MHNKRLWTAGVLVGLLGVALGLNHLTKAAPAPKITVAGSTAMQPLLRAAAKANPDLAITLHGGGSISGLKQVANHTVTLGASDIFAATQKTLPTTKLVDQPIAVVGITIIAGAETGVTNLTHQQLQQIFTGRLTNWQQLGGHMLPITVINRPETSGTRAAFDQLVLGGTPPLAATTVASSAAVRTRVAHTPGAISYLAFSARKPNDRQLTLDQQAPTAANVATNRWPLWTYEHLYSLGSPDAPTTRLIQYLQSQRGQQALAQRGYLPLATMQVARTAAGQIEDTH
ncbi:MAG: substrate-binding domain-containing protein [Lactobacillus sp.]|nr:substrate-binding domain-containing protein [Lactobacillus sp.]MCI2032583.1 substrate-binding domain-containing protein [Lactobacillus sp.]